MGIWRPVLALAAMAAGTVMGRAGQWEGLLRTLREAEPHGRGTEQLRAAWKELAQAGAERLPDVLAAIDDASPLGANWLRTAADAIAERQLRGGGPFPAEAIQRFLADRSHAPRARRLAYELLAARDPSAPERLLDGMLDDPSVELRRDAVARLITRAEGMAQRGSSHKALALFRKALAAARDLDQIQNLAARLRDAGQTVDLARQLGFLVRWKLIGPFDNTGDQGFDARYPPERELDLRAVYPGKHGPVRWIDHVTADEYGKVDLNRVFGEEKAVIAYAAATFIADEPQTVQFRVASANAVKVWLNGQPVGQYHVYHAGTQLDQYVMEAPLRPGRNVILLKVCQNEQTQDWARVWAFQLRVCDATGGAVLSADRE